MRDRSRRDLHHFWPLALVSVIIFVATQIANASTLVLFSGDRKTSSSNQTSGQQNCDEVRANLQRLNQEMSRLRKRLAELEKDRQINTIQDMLTKEEQRGESLQLHLIEIAEKETPLQARMDQLTQQLRPERIESAMSGVGSVHPEEARDELRRRLVSDRLRILSQLDLLRQDRIRTQASLATADAAIQRLKIKLTEALKE